MNIASSEQASFTLPTKQLALDRADAWAVFQCLQAHLAGFSGRAETAEPWHGTKLMRKLIELLPSIHEFNSGYLDLTEGELICLMYNVPPDAYERARDLLLRTARLIEEYSWPILLSREESPPVSQDMIDRFKEYWDSLK